MDAFTEPTVASLKNMILSERCQLVGLGQMQLTDSALSGLLDVLNGRMKLPLLKRCNFTLKSTSPAFH